jgi:hypothetical protein
LEPDVLVDSGGALRLDGEGPQLLEPLHQPGEIPVIRCFRMFSFVSPAGSSPSHRPRVARPR